MTTQTQLAQSGATLEVLIHAYQTAIRSLPYDAVKVASLSEAVEFEADRIHYADHRRLHSLHTEAETAGIIASGGKCDWETGPK